MVSLTQHLCQEEVVSNSLRQQSKSITVSQVHSPDCQAKLQVVLTKCLLLQVSENRLIGLLEQVNEQSSSRTKVTIQRRRALDDDY